VGGWQEDFKGDQVRPLRSPQIVKGLGVKKSPIIFCQLPDEVIEKGKLCFSG